jgi:hypothetical protein
MIVVVTGTFAWAGCFMTGFIEKKRDNVNDIGILFVYNKEKALCVHFTIIMPKNAVR